MKDLKGMYDYLINKEEPKFIGTNETFSKEEFKKLCEIYKNANKTEFMKCFDILSKGEHASDYMITLQCIECKEEFVEHLSKIHLFSMLRDISHNKNEYICKNCKRELNKLDDEKFRALKEEQKTRIFETYLNPCCSWNKGVKTYEKINEIKNYLVFVEMDEIKDYIHKIGYQQYLKTPLWNAVAEYKKQRTKHCQLCGTVNNLNVHHSSYNHIGFEIYNLNDLIVLCKECHYKFHDKIENL